MTLQIHANWLEGIDDVPSSVTETPEDAATLGEIEICAGGTFLTEAVDARTAELRRGANLPAYQLAQWLVWHWWRLRWETRSLSRRDAGRRWRGGGPSQAELNWHEAHNLGELGDGWLWPMVIFESDDARMAIRSEPSSDTPAEPLRFLGSPVVVVPAGDWDAGVATFVDHVLDRLADCQLKQTDLKAMWRELKAERADPELAAYRKIEARLGFDVDDADPKAVERIHRAGSTLGHAAMLEVAADAPAAVGDFREVARECGFPSRVADRPSPVVGVGYGEHGAPWRVGVEVARCLRVREGLGDGPLSDRRLTELCAVSGEALAHQRKGTNPLMAFSLKRRSTEQVVLRSNWRTNRRFEAARLLGDSLVVDVHERLRPATAASTYRQKMQRAFAAEFLCPIESLMDSLDDLSDEGQEQAAKRFKVSPWLVASQLANNGCLHETHDWEVAA